VLHQVKVTRGKEGKTYHETRGEEVRVGEGEVKTCTKVMYSAGCETARAQI